MLYVFHPLITSLMFHQVAVHPLITSLMFHQVAVYSASNSKVATATGKDPSKHRIVKVTSHCLFLSSME
jgi:hypothetical protein